MSQLYTGIPDIEYISNNECSKALSFVYDLNTSIQAALALKAFHTEIELEGTTNYDVAMAEIARQVIKNEGFNVDYFVNRDTNKIEWIVSWKVGIK